MKKLLALVLALVMLCSLFTACGGGSTPSSTSSSTASSTASSKAPAPADDAEEEEAEEEEEQEADSDDIVAEYEAIMSGFIGNFEDLMGSLGELLALSEEIASEEDLYVWCEEFDNIKAIVGASADELANVAEYVPEEYQESHVAITIAVAAVYDAMTGFEDAVAGAISGDADAFEDGLGEFVGNIVGADELWQSAVA